MKQVYLKCLLLGILSLVGIKAEAYDCKVDGIYYNLDKSAKTASVTYLYSDKDAYKGSVTIPSSFTYSGTTYNVTSIGDTAFRYCSGLTSVTIPNSVTSIGWGAFYNCSGLTSVTIPNSVTSIGHYAFYNCSGLTSVTIPSSVTSIEDGAFYGCSGLTSVTIPSSVTSIGPNPFSGCSGLTTIVVDGGNSVYDSRKNCNAIIQTATNTLIAGCKNTTIPNNITSIGRNAFEGCSGLTSVTIPNSVTTIESYAFSGCIGLTSVTIPNSVTTIESYAFSGCTGLTSVNFNATNCIIMGSPSFPVFKGCGSFTTLKIGENVKNIPNYAFYGCSGLTSVTIPNSVTSIGSSAFYGCSGLTSVTIPNSVTSIGERTFYGCSGLTSVTIPNSVASIGDYAFEYCSCLTSVTIPNSVTYVGYMAFYGCDRLISFTTSTTISTGIYLEAGSSLSFTLTDSKYNSAAVVHNGQIKFTGLDPMCHYQIYRIGPRDTTKKLTFTTSQPKVISAGNVIVAAESNIDDEETNVGFEWRRTDWSDDFVSNKGNAYLYNGMMEGYIRNLYTEKLWKFRPYYTSNAGNTYYGEWVGIDPTNTSYFEPTVHTYANISVNGNSAEVKGYAMRGTDNVTSQGFAYWVQSSNVKERGDEKAAPAMAQSIPSNAKIVEASGQVMTATLSGLNYGTTYCYVAFVKTSEGETFYGEQQSFSIGEDPMGIDGIMVDASDVAPVTVVARYNLNGQQITTPQRGVNILRMSDGTVRKVLVK